MNKKQHRVRLKNCPIGLFEYDGTICLKTEYSLDECYTVDGGEVFWGDGSKTRETKGDFLVTPTSIEQLQKQAVKEFIEKAKETSHLSGVYKDNVVFCSTMLDLFTELYGANE